MRELRIAAAEHLSLETERLCNRLVDASLLTHPARSTPVSEAGSMYRSTLCVRAIVFFLVLLSCGWAYADVGLIVENPTGPLGFFSDVGHASVWISDGCLDEQGEVRYCEHSSGIVLTSTSYWPNPGTAAIPAELFFLGSAANEPDNVHATWDETLAKAYPKVPEADGRKYFGRVWRRETNVLVFATSAEEDLRILQTIQQERSEYHYNYLRHNCADYAEMVLRLYLGKKLKVRRWLDLGVTTPRALQRALVHALGKQPEGTLTRYHFAGLKRHKWRQPPRNLCESAVLDPKYAVPLVFYQPVAYAGFGICYGVTRLLGLRGSEGEMTGHMMELQADETGMSVAEKKRATFAAMIDSSAAVHIATSGSLGVNCIVDALCQNTKPGLETRALVF